MYPQLENGKGYEMTHLALKKFKGEKYLVSTSKSNVTVKNVTYDCRDITISDEKVFTATRFESVEKINVYLLCSKCHRPITAAASEK